VYYEQNKKNKKKTKQKKESSSLRMYIAYIYISYYHQIGKKDVRLDAQQELNKEQKKKIK
jgi:hypothetical protein